VYHKRYNTLCFLALALSTACSDQRYTDHLVLRSNYRLSATRIESLFASLQKEAWVGTRLSKTKRNTVLFTANTGARDGVYEYDPNSGTISARLTPKDGDCSYAAEVGGQLYALCDRYGNEQYRLLDSEGREFLHDLDGKHRLYASPSGQHGLLVVRRLGSSTLLLFNHADTVQIAAQVTLPGDYQGHTFLRDERDVFIGTNRGAYWLEVRTGRARQAIPEWAQEVVSPTLDDARERIFFASAGKTSFREIYFLPLREEGLPQLFLESNQDKNFLQIEGDFLYYIENNTNRYFLKKIHVSNKDITSLTQEGVVYNFVSVDGEPIYVQANERHPYALYRFRSGQSSKLFGAERARRMRTQIIDPEDLSPAWYFSPEKEPKATLLWVHGGPDIDISPRWDPYLEAWLALDLEVVAPNYPGSRGYGLAHMLQPSQVTLEDLYGWLRKLRADSPHRPIFIDGLSYGGNLVKAILQQESERITCAIVRSSGSTNDDPFLTDRAKLPILYLLGRNDRLVPTLQLLEGIDAWAKRSKDVYYRIYRQEGHILHGRPALLDALHSMAWFLDQCLARS